MLSAVTGWDVTADEVREAGERIVNLKKLFNVREGWTRAEDTLPERFLAEALPGGATAGATLSREDLDRMILSYYRARGWNDQGEVPWSLRERLGLTDVPMGTRSPRTEPNESPARPRAR